jgi:hypothetical protein
MKKQHRRGNMQRIITAIIKTTLKQTNNMIKKEAKKHYYSDKK